MLTIESKQKAKQACLLKVGKRIEVCESQLKQLQQDLTNETKSSAGDKYETGRAMLHIEREKIGRQLAELEQLEQVIKTIEPTVIHQKIQLGSFVQTKDNCYFMAVSLGKMEVDGIPFYAISTQTPMAQVLLGRSKGDRVNFRETSFEIEGVV